MLGKGVVDPNKLPPTSDAVHQHNRRVYLQTMVWRALDHTPLDPEQWGWKFSDQGYIPVQSTRDCAPSYLLNFICCKCKAGCGSRICSCRKHGLCCVGACSNCRGDCENSLV